MRLLFVVGSDFVYWPIAISNYIKNKLPEASFCSLVIASYSTYNLIQQQTNPHITPSIVVDDLENEWINTPYDINSLLRYENMLGANIINELIIADRYLGNEYVSGAYTLNTPLTKISRCRSKQLSYINGLLNFLFDFLTKEKPNIVFAPAVASAPTLALAKVSKYLGIHFRVLNATRFEQKYILDSSPYLDAPDLNNLYQQGLYQSTILGEYLDIAKEKLYTFRETPAAPEYWDYWYKFIKLPPNIKDTLALIYRTIQRRKPETLVYPFPFSRLYQEWRRYFIYLFYKIKRNYFYDLSILKNQKYIYFPLHYDPECSTMVLAPNYTNQLDLIERLSKNIPVNTILAVKEHIPMLGNRPNWFYKKIRSFTNVKLISPFVSSFEMIKNSLLTVVITGTAGFEALLLQKPTLCLGKIHYQVIKKGFIYCENINQLSNSIQEALNCQTASDHEICTYLACILKEGFDCKSEYLGINVDINMVKSSNKFVQDISEKLIDIMAN